MYIKLMIDGTTSQPFSAYSVKTPPPKDSCKEQIITFSQKKYGRERKVVESDIFKTYEKVEDKKQGELFG